MNERLSRINTRLANDVANKYIAFEKIEAILKPMLSSNNDDFSIKLFIKLAPILEIIKEEKTDLGDAFASQLEFYKEQYKKINRENCDNIIKIIELKQKDKKNTSLLL